MLLPWKDLKIVSLVNSINPGDSSIYGNNILTHDHPDLHTQKWVGPRHKSQGKWKKELR